MTVREIIIAHLRQVGADGLCSDNCGCGIDDLMPCEGESVDGGCRECIPAREAIANEAGEFHEVGDRIFIAMDAGTENCPSSDDIHCPGCCPRKK